MGDRTFENKAREQEMLLESIYHTMECGIIRYVKTGEDRFELLSMNQAALHMLDYETMQECIADGFDGTAGHVIKKDREKILSLTKTLEKPGDMVKFEYQAKGKRGDDRWILASSHFLKRDEKNRPVIQRTMTDITEKKQLELQLRQERELYQIAVESSEDILYEYDMEKDRFVMHVSDTDEDGNLFTGRKVVEDYRKKVMTGEAVHSGDISKLGNLLKNGTEEHMELQLKLDGSARWYQMTGRKILEHGCRAKIVGTMRDIHEMKKMRRENQSHLEELKINRLAIKSLSHSYTGIHYVNLRANTYYAVRIPEHLRSMIPKRGDYTEVIEHYVDTQIAFEDRRKVKAIIDPEYLIQNLSPKASHMEVEYRCVRREQNKPVWNRLEINLVSCRQNEPEFVTINFLDITGEKRKALKREYDNALLGYAISDSYDAIYEVELEQEAVYRVMFDGKQISRKKYSKSFSEIVLANLEKSIHPDSRKEYMEQIDLERLRRLEHENRLGEEYCEFLMKTQEGDYEWISFILRSVVRGEGKRVLVFEKNVDARKRRELENLEREQKNREAITEAYQAANRANEAKSLFLSRMSHDIRTPLNAIIGMTAIAGAHLEEPARIRECLEKISSSGKLLLNLINEVLDMSKVENGNISLNEEEIHLPDAVCSVLEQIKPDLALKSLELQTDFGILQHEDVIGDPLRLQQIFLNLLSNAIKYTPNGGKITLRVCEKQTTVDRAGCYEFVFEDTGIGMEPEFIPRMFEPFERAEDSRVSKVQGTGLGMTITQNIVQMMNGTIHVESGLNQGTCVTVTVFLKLPEPEDSSVKEQEEENVPADEPKGELPSFEGKRILLVEDNELNREIAMEIIGSTGVVIETAENGQEAVEMFEHVPEGYYDLIFMDIQMPVMNGHEAARNIRKLEHTRKRRVPVVAVTANAFLEDIQMSKEAGMDGHLAKPLDIQLLMETMRKWLTAWNRSAEEEN